MATTSRTGRTRYNQGITDSSRSNETTTGTSTRKGADLTTSKGVTTSKMDGKNDSIGKQVTTSTRDLTSNSEVKRTSIEKVNIGFAISFKVPIIGRFPTQSGPNC